MATNVGRVQNALRADTLDRTTLVIQKMLKKKTEKFKTILVLIGKKLFKTGCPRKAG